MVNIVRVVTSNLIRYHLRAIKLMMAKSQDYKRWQYLLSQLQIQLLFCNFYRAVSHFSQTFYCVYMVSHSSTSNNAQSLSQNPSMATSTMEFTSLTKSLNFNLPIKLGKANIIYWKTQALPDIQAIDLQDYLLGLNQPSNKIVYDIRINNN